MLEQIRKEIQQEVDPEKAQFLGRFFKTGKGEYAEGDVFLGLTVPQARIFVKKYRDLSLVDCIKLLHSKIHEERLIALLIMVSSFAKASEDRRKKIYDAYLDHTKYINNWDLVDLSAANIVGEYLYSECHPELDSGSHKKKMPDQVRHDNLGVLEKLAKSENLWEKRIAIIATFAFIRKGEYETTFKIADILLDGMTASNAASATKSVASHDLIHKAVGWMLREVGKRISEEALENYLKPRYKTVPRTMLRYAIERFEEGKERNILQERFNHQQGSLEVLYDFYSAG